jgi:hypothetical protein
MSSVGLMIVIGVFFPLVSIVYAVLLLTQGKIGIALFFLFWWAIWSEDNNQGNTTNQN